MHFHIQPLWTDDDTLMQVRISLAGNGRESWGEAYCYPQKFLEFGRALIDFPSSISHEVKFELGSTDSRYAEHLLLRAFVHDSVGHCALEFIGETRGNAIVSSSVRFAVPTQAASLNELGRQILVWAESPTLLFSFEGTGS